MRTWLALVRIWTFKAEQTAFIKHESLDANSLLVSRTVHALLITVSEGNVSFLTRSVASPEG